MRSRWPAGAPPFQLQVTEDGGGINSVAISPTGEAWALGDAAGCVRLWSESEEPCCHAVPTYTEVGRPWAWVHGPALCLGVCLRGQGECVGVCVCVRLHECVCECVRVCVHVRTCARVCAAFLPICLRRLPPHLFALPSSHHQSPPGGHTALPHSCCAAPQVPPPFPTPLVEMEEEDSFAAAAQYPLESMELGGWVGAQ